jgi:hypothetical protein
MLRLPQYLDNWLTDGGKFVSLTRRLPPYFQKHYFLFLVLISVTTKTNSVPLSPRANYTD